MFESIATIAQVAFTGLLVWATFLLAKHTRTLARLTERLARIEEEREKRTQKELALNDIRQVLELADDVLKIMPENFTVGLERGRIPEYAATSIKGLLSFARYFVPDAGTIDFLKELISWIDNVRAGSSIGGNRAVIEKALQNAQAGLRGFQIHRWRAQLISGEPTQPGHNIST